MGYQIVDVQTTDRTKPGVVFNAELLTLDEDALSDRIVLRRLTQRR